MYSRIKRLRRGGERKEDREISADPGQVATVTMATVENVVVIEAFEPGIGGRRALICPPMWRARVVSMHGDKMLVQGFERTGNPDDPNSAVQKQEWAIQVMVDQPEELARMPHRPPV
jgi:hypothetical protein